MTRSPLAVTLIPLLPLLAIAWPLSDVLSQEAYQAPPSSSTDSPVGPLITALLSVQSAHPFESLSVTIGKATWTFRPDEEEEEIHFPAGKEVVLTVSVTWPPDTPETAILIRLIPDNLEERSDTLWGSGSLGVTKGIKFTWEDTP